MKIVVGLPPNIADIEKVFGKACREPGVFFCYGDTIFNPTGEEIPEQLVRHEEVHSRRQGNFPEIWWAQYLTDTAFRYQEELVAHQAEYQDIKTRTTKGERKRYLNAIAERLSSALYGHVVTFAEAKRAIKREEEDTGLTVTWRAK
jgi:hypothetical protein